MGQTKAMTYQYDWQEDILYATFGASKEAICLEEDEGVLIRVDPETDEVVGFTIIDFVERFKRKAEALSIDVIPKCVLSDRLKEQVLVTA